MSYALKLEEKALVDQVHRDFQKLCQVYNNGTKDTKNWYKQLICLSYRLLSAKITTEAVRLLDLIPKIYFEMNLSKQMEEDPGFANIAYQTANLLVENRLVTPETNIEIQATQSPAQA